MEKILDYTMKVLIFKEKIGMIGVGDDWVCVDIRNHAKKDNHCLMSINKKDMKIIGLIEEKEMLKGIEEGKIIVGAKTKFIYKGETPKK